MQGLARSLVADKSRADDLVQETWLAALRRGPDRLGSLRAWLGRVLRNAARQETRRSTLRLEREPMAARPEALPSAASIAERAELQRCLVGAVLALDEPYRSTLLWHYFEELSSEEIARRLSVPASTVRNRLRRGLEILRAALERRDGASWRVGCLALAVWSAGAREAGAGVTAKWIAGGVLVGTKAKIAAGGAVVLVASVAVWKERERAAEPELAVTAPLEENDLPTSVPVEETDAMRGDLAAGHGRAAERRAMEPSSAASAADPAIGFVVLGAIRAPDGSPPADARVELRDEWGELADAPIGGRSSYAISGLHSGRWSFSLRDCPGFFLRMQPIQLGGEPMVRADLELQGAARIAIRLVTPSGEQPESRFKDDAWRGVYVPRVDVVATREPLPVEVSGHELARLRCGTYTSADQAGSAGRPQVPEGFNGVLELDQPPPAHASAMLRGRVLASAPIDEQARELVLLIDLDRMQAMLGALRFRLLDARTGEPIAQVGVQLYERSPGDWANPVITKLDQGRFERLRLPSGDYQLQLRVPGFEHPVRTIRIEPGRTTDLGDILLAEGSAVRGRVVDETGKGISVGLAWSPLDAGDDPTYVAHLGMRSNNNGGFALAELPTHGVLLRVSDSEWALDPVPIRAPPGAIQEGFELMARRGTEVTLRQRLASDAEVGLLLRRADGTAIWSVHDLQPATHAMRLVAGTYTLEARRNGRPLATRAFEVASEPVQIDLAP
jgi:RNA polymerase sigma-70 factor (ECF subfamily)